MLHTKSVKLLRSRAYLITLREYYGSPIFNRGQYSSMCWRHRVVFLPQLSATGIGEPVVVCGCACKIKNSYWVRVVTCAAVVFLCRRRCAVGKAMIYSYI